MSRRSSKGEVKEAYRASVSVEVAQVERAIHVINDLTARMPSLGVEDLTAFLRHPSRVENIPNIPPLDLEEYLQRAVSSTGRLVDAEMTAFGIRNGDNEMFLPWIFAGGRTDLEDEIRLLVRGHAFPHEGGLIKTFMGVPIRYKGSIIGDLYVANKPTPFTEQDRYILELFATHIGVVLAQSFLLWLAAGHAQELSQLRDQFAAMVAHDLRNPIHAILLHIGMLRRLQITPINPALDAIERSTTRLSRLTNDLLDVARIQLSRVRLAKQKVAILDLVHTVIRGMALPLRSVSVLGENLPDVCLDPARFEQILVNLIDNAAKSSLPTAPIEVHTRAQGEGVEVAVTDHGVGIAKEEIDRLFDRFYQSARAQESKSGLGLGLYIVRGLVDAHGGRVTVESQVGVGSTFRVWFPYNAPDTEDKD